MAARILLSRAFALASSSTPSLPVTFCNRLLTFLASPPCPSVASARNLGIFSFSCRGQASAVLPITLFSLHKHDRLFTSEATTKINTKVNFSLTDSEEDDDENDENGKTNRTVGAKDIDKNKLPPPYDPFSKKPIIEEPKDPKDLQEIFHNISTKDGLLNNAVKMFDALSKDGLTHEALELFAQIKDKGHMPDVVAHTAVIEAYANAGQPKEALRVYLRMLASGVAPNAYTYTVLIQGLAADAKCIGDAKKYVMEMMGKGMRPNASTCTAVFEALIQEQKLDEARELLEQMKNKGFVPDEKAVRELLKNKRGQDFRTVVNILFEK
ncbi:hypothetical protein CJ030_MR5G009953 [Morella rubra]|uniref:Pentacotripeptide-repeat region of PRORP domain-containing protein n=1 Tax=Morella rubra TaxID=262757 RepID=A0A6A1VSP7_9ROSI|nr:hypothetical protein CJ030_MR5G009953 [Morella rubra]